MNQYNKKLFGALVTLLIADILLLAVFYRPNNLPVNHAEWQAVFLTDGQVYFGKLESYNRQYAALRNVYYLKFAEGLQQDLGSGRSNELSGHNLNLIKLGGEAHGPEGEMFIPKDKILFFENLKDNSPVVEAIVSNNH